MATRLPSGTRNAIVNAIVQRIDAGSGPGSIDIRTGSQPASAGSAATGTLLATVVLADPSFPGAVNGTAALNGVPRSDVADDSGTAGWFRVKDSDGNFVLDGMCTMAGGGGEMILDNTNLATGQTFRINSLSLTAPAE